MVARGALVDMDASTVDDDTDYHRSLNDNRQVINMRQQRQLPPWIDWLHQQNAVDINYNMDGAAMAVACHPNVQTVLAAVVDPNPRSFEGSDALNCPWQMAYNVLDDERDHQRICQ